MKPDEREAWLEKDPLPRFEEFLEARGLLDEARKQELADRMRSAL